MPPAVENLISWHRPAAVDVLILRAVNCSLGFDVFHDSYDICEMRKGACDYVYRGTKLTGLARNLQLFEPGEIHRTPRVMEPGTIRVLHLPTRLVDQCADELGLPSTPVHWKKSLVEHPSLFEVIERFHDSVERPSSALEVQERLAECVESLLRSMAERVPPSARTLHEPLALTRARDTLLSRWEEDLSLDELAQVAGLSRFHFLRVFKAKFGCPPHSFQLRIRLTKARQLLASGVPPAMTAASTGFCDQSHLTRYFKWAWKVTPAEYSAAVRGR